MFNLFVEYASGSWNEATHKYGVGRVITWTTGEVKEQFANLDSDSIDTLKKYPCLFTYETESPDRTTPARIGWLKGVRKHQNSVEIAYTIDNTFPPIPMEALEKLSWDLDIQTAEMYNTHWSVKKVDLFSVLIDAELISRNLIENLPAARRHALQLPVTDLQVRPKVFRVPPTPIEQDLVSAMMPFNTDFDEVFSALSEECIRLGLRCQRADGIWEEEEVFQDIFSLIYRSKTVICDFTGRNPNVFYEAGIAHTLGRTVIPITQSNNDVPFDLQHYRYVHYLNNAQGLTSLQESIRPRLQGLAMAA